MYGLFWAIIKVDMFLAWKEIKHEKTRFILIVAVIALVSYLTYFLVALSYGLATSYTNAISKWDADGIVIPQDANNTIGRSRMLAKDVDSVISKEKATLGLAAIVVQDISADKNKHVDASVFGVDLKSFLMPKTTEGREINKSGEAIADSSLKDAGYKIGDNIQISDIKMPIQIVGFTDNATYQTVPVVYMTTDDWRELLAESMDGIITGEPYVSAVIVKNDKTLNGILSDDSNLSIQSIQDFYYSLPGYQAQVLTFGLMIGFLIFIASFVLGIFIYILTLQKKSIFGVLKAQGIPSSMIGISVIYQTLILAGIGLSIGLILTLLSGWGLSGKVPFVVQPMFFIVISLLFVFFSNLGALFSVRAVTKIDPIEAIG